LQETKTFVPAWDLWRGKMKVCAFNGSPRPKGNTFLLLSIVLEELKKEGIDTEIVQVGGKPIQGCLACFQCYKNKDRRCAVDSDRFNGHFAKMVEADGILLGTPTYFSDVSSWMKALIERAGFVGRANDGLLRRKVAAGVAAVRRAGAIHALSSMNHFFLHGEMIVPGSTYWNLGIGREEGEVTKDEEGVQTMKALGRNMAWLMKKLA
jgi:multimeric flavodoxin WrbA